MIQLNDEIKRGIASILFIRLAQRLVRQRESTVWMSRCPLRSLD
jgi:hypothetical protein